MLTRNDSGGFPDWISLHAGLSARPVFCEKSGQWQAQQGPARLVESMKKLLQAGGESVYKFLNQGSPTKSKV
jgi:hypothetical protein